MNAGYVQTTGTAFGKPVDPVVTVKATVAGGPVTVQLRAWHAAFATHEAALAANAPHGESDLLALGGTGIPPSTSPVNLDGLEGFKMVDGSWLRSKDVLDYIKANPASSSTEPPAQ